MLNLEIDGSRKHFSNRKNNQTTFEVTTDFKNSEHDIESINIAQMAALFSASNVHSMGKTVSNFKKIFKRTKKGINFDESPYINVKPEEVSFVRSFALFQRKSPQSSRYSQLKSKHPVAVNASEQIVLTPETSQVNTQVSILSSLKDSLNIIRTNEVDQLLGQSDSSSIAVGITRDIDGCSLSSAPNQVNLRVPSAENSAIISINLNNNVGTISSVDATSLGRPSQSTTAPPSSSSQNVSKHKKLRSAELLVKRPKLIDKRGKTDAIVYNGIVAASDRVAGTPVISMGFDTRSSGTRQSSTSTPVGTEYKTSTPTPYCSQRSKIADLRNKAKSEESSIAIYVTADYPAR